MNATMLTVQSWQEWYTLQQIHNSSRGWNNLPHQEAWMGLTNTVYGHTWIDCTPLDFSKFILFKDQNQIDFRHDHQCYTTKEHDSYRWKQKKCEDKYAVICEQQLQGVVCPLSTILAVDIYNYKSEDESSCQNSCDSDENCNAMISFSNGTDHCLHLRKTSTSSLAKVAIKLCAKGEIKMTDEVVTPTKNDDKTPIFTCSNSLAINVDPTSTVTIINTTTVSIMPSSTIFIEPTSCFNITVFETATVYHNLTTYIPEKTISYIQSHFTATMTTVVPTTVIMTSYIPPSTVTVEVTPSLTSCNNNQTTKFVNITNTQYIQEAVENITKALYMDKTTISSYVRSKTCAEDKRTSSATVGYFGIVLIAVPFGLMFLLDLHQICLQLSETVKRCCRKERKV
ncbi:uncharacterized protein LOC134235926 [Saccostrea cucullata]|uniref:uncharacterized protein LOC134235926 n=1 Tax=Saccostrea cuccullata TaxID=36930 RepID=UPI002ED4F466